MLRFLTQNKKIVVSIAESVVKMSWYNGVGSNKTSGNLWNCGSEATWTVMDWRECDAPSQSDLGCLLEAINDDAQIFF